MKKGCLLFTVLIFLLLNFHGQVSGDFRSLASGSGNWNDFTSWEMYDGSTATGIPTQVRSLASIPDSVFISSLAPNTLYHYRIVGTSATSAEIIYGSDMTFTTTGGIAGLWTGMTSTDCATASNWDNHIVPTTLNDIVIPALAPNWPLYTGTVTLGTTCNSITLAGAASQLTVTSDMVIPAGFTVTNNGAIHLLTH